MPIQLPDQGLSIFTMPKNGGTTLWEWCYFILKREEVSGNVYDQGWMCDGPVEKETLMIRRDPVERFISGYRNFRDKRGLTLEFSEFVRELPNLLKVDGSIRHHFAPQCEYFPWMPLEKVDHVFDLSEFSEVKEFLEERVGFELPSYHSQKSYFEGFEVTDRDVELIQQYYVNDYIAGFGDIVDDEIES
jgi:hypothetical protein